MIERFGTIPWYLPFQVDPLGFQWNEWISIDSCAEICSTSDTISRRGLIRDRWNLKFGSNPSIRSSNTLETVPLPLLVLPPLLGNRVGACQLALVAMALCELCVKFYFSCLNRVSHRFSLNPTWTEHKIFYWQTVPTNSDDVCSKVVKLINFPEIFF